MTSLNRSWRLRVGVDVGVQLAGQLAVGLLDRVGVRVAGRPRGCRTGPGSRQSFGSVQSTWGSSFVEDPGDVARDRAHRRHRPGVVHAGRARRCPGSPAPRRPGRSPSRRRWSRPAPGRGPRAPMRTVTAPPVRRLAEQLEQHDVLLERLEQRPDGGVEAVAEPGQVGGAADRDPLVGAVVGHRLDQRRRRTAAVTRARRPSGRRPASAAAASAIDLAGGGPVDRRAQVGERVVVERRRAARPAAARPGRC